ncbi:uncharacterized protein LOC124299663 [Neodiprion virginianus]|uniref:uncharacterized protein LOC124299663 n=1 Tax=Neodiprion virginianus TaxID=2961670 RepID=UPI001EE73473|nr:uncharacterized protein LOC124299663 [Neodiprion virginianus]
MAKLGTKDVGSLYAGGSLGSLTCSVIFDTCKTSEWSTPWMAFAYADVEGKKFLTKHQYKIAMTAMFGFCPDKWDIKQMLADTSNNGNLITFQKFQNSVRRKIDSSENFLDFDYFFTCLDGNSKGYLIFDDLLTAAEEVNLKIPPVILKGAFKELDHDRKGFIRMHDFVAMMRCR